MMLADLHIHSTYSDGKLTIPEIVDYFGSRGVKIIAITDHLCEENTFLGKASNYLKKTLTKETFSLYLQEIAIEGERARRQYGMMVIPGVELTKNSLAFHKSAHILAIGISEFIQADGTIRDLITRIKNQDALSIAAHPVSTRNFEHQTYQLWDQRNELAEHFDAWEVASGPFLFHEVMQSGLPIIANSDFHHPKQMRSWKTMINCEQNWKSIKHAIKNQNVQFTFFEEKDEALLNISPSNFEFLEYASYQNGLTDGQREEAEKLIPPLLKSYIKFGAKIACEPSFDRDFDCVDLLTVLKKEDMTNSLARRFQLIQ